MAPPPVIPAFTPELTSRSTRSDPDSRARTTAFYVLLIGFVSCTILLLVYSIWKRRRNGRPNQQIQICRNIEAAYKNNSNYTPRTRSRTLNSIRNTAGIVTNAIQVKRKGKFATRNNPPEEIELALPKSARVHYGMGTSARGAGAAAEAMKIGQEAGRKGVGTIQQRRRDSEMERQKRRSGMEARDPAPQAKSLQDHFEPYDQSITLEEALKMTVEDDEKVSNGGSDFSIVTAEKDFA